MKNILKNTFIAIITSIALLSSCENETKKDYIRLSDEKVELIKGQKRQISAEIAPHMQSKDIIWSTTDYSIATVDDNGIIEAVKPGETKVIATVGQISATCMVTVLPIEINTLTLNHNEYSMIKGGKLQLTATITPENADYDIIEWTSSDNSVATVDNNGLVKAQNEGETKIIASANGKSAECSILVMSAQIGDFFYSDGSFSNELDNSKTPIGIVFWTGDPTTDDRQLKNNFPNCTNGLVVALGEMRGRWQTGTSKSVNDWMLEQGLGYEQITTGTSLEENLNKMLGYNNSLIMESFNEDKDNETCKLPAIDSVKSFRIKTPAPENTSGWYLPSPKEISLLCNGEYEGNIWDIYSSGENFTENRDFINERISKISNAIPLGANDVYWTSGEYDYESAVYLFMKKGYVKYDYKSSPLFKLRPILAF